MPRINLMPRSELMRRERESVTRRWVWVVLGAIVLALVIIAGAFTLSWVAEQRLAAEQAHTNQLLVELSGLSEVSTALAAEQELTKFRSDAMVADFVWAPLLAKVAGALPADASLTGYDVTGGGAPQGDDPTQEAGLTGTFSFTSPTPIDIVATIRSLRQVDGILLADGQSLTSGSIVEGTYSYILDVTFDQTIYSGAYAAPEGENG
jgi:hypothetical protein